MPRHVETKDEKEVTPVADQEETLVVGSSEWRAAKRAAQQALDERLGTTKIVRPRNQRIEPQR